MPPDEPTLDYRSPEPRRPLPPEQWEAAYGCVPAAVAGVTSVVGVALTAVARSSRHWPIVVVTGVVAVVGLAVGWRSAVAVCRSPRGGLAGTLVVIAVAGLTVLAGCLLMLPRR